jgi:hypothetical protein
MPSRTDSREPERNGAPEHSINCELGSSTGSARASARRQRTCFKSARLPGRVTIPASCKFRNSDWTNADRKGFPNEPSSSYRRRDCSGPAVPQLSFRVERRRNAATGFSRAGPWDSNPRGRRATIPAARHNLDPWPAPAAPADVRHQPGRYPGRSAADACS